MPQFIKMGLGGTGYLGHQETAQRAKIRFARRRMVLPGFPINKPFESINDVREYLGGDRIACLLCGKNYKSIGVHLLKIHDITADKYREKYKIPWTYALASRETSAIHREIMAKRIEKGFMIPAQYRGTDLAIHSKKRECFFKSQVGISNLADYVGSIRINIIKKNGGIPPVAKEQNRAKKGSQEFHEKMRNRPQVKTTTEIFKNYWRGKKQSEDHKRKRFESRKNTMAKRQGTAN